MAVAAAPAGADATASLRVGTQGFLLEDAVVSAPQLVAVHGADRGTAAALETGQVGDLELYPRHVGRVTVRRVAQHERVGEVGVRAVDQRDVAVGDRGGGGIGGHDPDWKGGGGG